jgi:hypothetical protein
MMIRLNGVSTVKKSSSWMYTVPKNLGVFRKYKGLNPQGNFPLILENEATFPRIIGKFLLQELSSLNSLKSALFLGEGRVQAKNN